MIRRDVPRQRVAREHRDERFRDDDLGVDEHRRRNVRDEIRQKHQSRGVGDRHRLRRRRARASVDLVSSTSS